MDETVIYNPLLINCTKEDPILLYDPEIKKKIKSTDWSQWTCSVCYNSVNKPSILCYPFKCDHAICYKCFKQICFTFIPRQRPTKVKCPLCRKLPNNEWIRCPSILTKLYKSNNIDYVINVPGYRIKV